MSRGKRFKDVEFQHSHIRSSFDQSQQLETEEHRKEAVEVEFYEMTHTERDDSFVRNESRDTMERTTSLSQSSSSSDSTRVKAQIYAALRGPKQYGQMRGHKVEVTHSQSSVMMSRYNQDAKQTSTTEEAKGRDREREAEVSYRDTFLEADV